VTNHPRRASSRGPSGNLTRPSASTATFWRAAPLADIGGHGGRPGPFCHSVADALDPRCYFRCGRKRKGRLGPGTCPAMLIVSRSFERLRPQPRNRPPRLADETVPSTGRADRLSRLVGAACVGAETVHRRVPGCGGACPTLAAAITSAIAPLEIDFPSYHAGGRAATFGSLDWGRPYLASRRHDRQAAYSYRHAALFSSAPRRPREGEPPAPAIWTSRRQAGPATRCRPCDRPSKTPAGIRSSPLLLRQPPQRERGSPRAGSCRARASGAGEGSACRWGAGAGTCPRGGSGARRAPVVGDTEAAVADR